MKIRTRSMPNSHISGNCVTNLRLQHNWNGVWMTVSNVCEQLLLFGTVHRVTNGNNKVSMTHSSSHVGNTFKATRLRVSSYIFKEPILKAIRESTLIFILLIGLLELNFMLSLKRSIGEIDKDVGRAFDSLELSLFPSIQVDSLGVTGEDVLYEGDETDE